MEKLKRCFRTSATDSCGSGGPPPGSDGDDDESHEGPGGGSTDSLSKDSSSSHESNNNQGDQGGGRPSIISISSSSSLQAFTGVLGGVSAFLISSQFGLTSGFLPFILGLPFSLQFSPSLESFLSYMETDLMRHNDFDARYSEAQLSGDGKETGDCAHTPITASTQSAWAQSVGDTIIQTQSTVAVPASGSTDRVGDTDVDQSHGSGEVQLIDLDQVVGDFSESFVDIPDSIPAGGSIYIPDPPRTPSGPYPADLRETPISYTDGAGSSRVSAPTLMEITDAEESVDWCTGDTSDPAREDFDYCSQFISHPTIQVWRMQDADELAEMEEASRLMDEEVNFLSGNSVSNSNQRAKSLEDNSKDFLEIRKFFKLSQVGGEWIWTELFFFDIIEDMEIREWAAFRSRSMYWYIHCKTNLKLRKFDDDDPTSGSDGSNAKKPRTSTSSFGASVVNKLSPDSGTKDVRQVSGGTRGLKDSDPFHVNYLCLVGVLLLLLGAFVSLLFADASVSGLSANLGFS